jgi:hypothetical protein
MHENASISSSLRKKYSNKAHTSGLVLGNRPSDALFDNTSLFILVQLLQLDSDTTITTFFSTVSHSLLFSFFFSLKKEKKTMSWRQRGTLACTCQMTTWHRHQVLYQSTTLAASSPLGNERHVWQGCMSPLADSVSIHFVGVSHAASLSAIIPASRLIFFCLL